MSGRHLTLNSISKTELYPPFPPKKSLYLLVFLVSLNCSINIQIVQAPYLAVTLHVCFSFLHHIHLTSISNQPHIPPNRFTLLCLHLWKHRGCKVVTCVHCWPHTTHLQTREWSSKNIIHFVSSIPSFFSMRPVPLGLKPILFTQVPQPSLYHTAFLCHALVILALSVSL